jgi:hypothetical protein
MKTIFWSFSKNAFKVRATVKGPRKMMFKGAQDAAFACHIIRCTTARFHIFLCNSEKKRV